MTAKRFYTERQLGLVSENFSDAETLNNLSGNAAIGHTRYSTQGATVLRNVQPLYADLDQAGIAIAHNGNLTNSKTLRADLGPARLYFSVHVRFRNLSATDGARAIYVDDGQTHRGAESRSKALMRSCRVDPGRIDRRS